MITFVFKTVVSSIICAGAKILMQYVRVEANICAVFPTDTALHLDLKDNFTGFILKQINR